MCTLLPMISIRKAAAALLAAAATLSATTPTATAAPDETLFRENFDSLPLGPLTTGHTWTTDVSDGALTVERSAPGHGRELNIHTAGNGRAFLKITGLHPPGNSLWARLRLRVDAFPTAPDWAHWTIAEAAGADSPTLVRPLGGQYVPTEDTNLWGVGSDLGPTGDWTDWQTSAPATAGGWQCVEFHLDATDNRVTVYFNGVEQPDLTVSTTHHGGTADDFVFPTFHSIKLGWQLYQPDPTPASYNMRMDDIVLRTKRVGGCSR